LQEDDRLTLIGDPPGIKELRRWFGSWHSRPTQPSGKPKRKAF